MTVSSQTNNATFVGNGVTTVFPLPFRFFSNGDVFAYFIDSTTGASTPMVLGTDYTLAGAGEPEVDGNAVSVLTTTAPLANGRGLYVERIMQEVQNTDIVNQGEFFASTHEDVFDRLTMLIQQESGGWRGAIRVSIGEEEPDRLVPAMQRAGLLLGFDEEGQPQAVAPTSGSAEDLAIRLANIASPFLGAALIGRGVQAVKTITELRDLLKTSPAKHALVTGYTTQGDSAGGFFYLDESDTTSADNGFTVFVAADGGRWKPVSNNYPTLPLTQTAYNITNAGLRLKHPAHNLLKNPSWYIWHGTGIAPMATSIAENSNAITQAHWRMETAGTGTTITGIQRITSPEGGLRFTANFGATTGYAYVRQNVLGVRQFSNKTLTTTVDIEVDAACSINFYMLLRFNAANDATNRPVIVDSEPLALTAGRHTIALSMTTPDVTLNANTVNLQESLEYTIRVLGVSSSVTVRIYGACLTPGREVFAPRSVDPLRDQQDADTRYETGKSITVGFNTTSGQKRVFAKYRAPKYNGPGTFTYADIVGNVGKISTYDVAGVRTDNVTPTVVTPGTDGVEVILNASTAAGIGFQYVVNTYF